MKPVIIIAIAVGCSVVAVFGVLLAYGGFMIWQTEVKIEEYQKQLEVEEEKQRQQAIQEHEDFKIIDQDVKQVKELSREKYKEVEISHYSQIYNDCLSTPQKYYETENILNVFCKEILNDIVNNYCNEKIESFSFNTESVHYNLCVNITNNDIQQNKQITMESEKIIECFETYAQRENIADICIRTWN